MKSEGGEKIMIHFVALRSKTYSFWIYDRDENEKADSTQKCVKKQTFKFEDCKKYLK